METQVVAKNMIMAVFNWGQKMAAHRKTWCGISVVGLGLNLISLLPKTHCKFSLFFLQWMLCICFHTNKKKHLNKNLKKPFIVNFSFRKLAKVLYRHPTHHLISFS
jgi:hypothetical protein